MVGERNRQYFVLMEQSVLCQVSSLSQALFVAFGCYYVYNLEYTTKASNIFFFFQDYLLGYPDSAKRPSSYIAVLSDIKKHLCQCNTLSGTPKILNSHLFHHLFITSHHIHPIHAYLILHCFENQLAIVYSIKIWLTHLHEGLLLLLHTVIITLTMLYQPIPSGLCILLPTFIYGQFTCVVRSLCL